MKVLISILLLLPFCLETRANSNFVGNPYLPYPAGCAQTPTENIQAWLESKAVPFFSEEITLLDAQNGSKIPVGLALYRSRCSEPRRSLIWLEFTLQNSRANWDVEISLPSVFEVKGDNWRNPMRLSPEPGGWQSGREYDRAQSFLTVRPNRLDEANIDYEISLSDTRRWLFVLDNMGPLGEWGKYFPPMTAEEYNGTFKLYLREDLPIIDVPATETLLPEPEPFIPLSGRQSGIWVIEGAADQGFSLAISEFVPLVETEQLNRETPELVVFLAHYTFDKMGALLWLTGSARFTPGTSEVIIPVERVTGGEFRGSRASDRVSIGNVTVRAINCNDLEFDYDYSGLELGSGTEHLQRPFSLETAGYECRDYAARVTANHPAQH